MLVIRSLNELRTKGSQKQSDQFVYIYIYPKRKTSISTGVWSSGMILALGDFLPKQEDKACERPWVQFPARPVIFFHHQGGIFLFSINQPNLSCFSKLKEVNSLYVRVATYICQKNESRFRTNRLKGDQ